MLEGSKVFARGAAAAGGARVEVTADIGVVANSVDISADQQVVAVGANNSLTLLRLWNRYRSLDVEESHFLKDTKHGASKSIGLLKPILKVKFNPTLHHAHYLATTSSSGAVGLWNLHHIKEDRGQWHPETVLREHNQAVSCLAWHYDDPSLLLTGSNDTKIKYWDMRVRQASNLTITPKSDTVRDIQFRKEDGSTQFAAAFANGTVQVWDVRHFKRPQSIYHAHDEAYTVDWNAEQTNLLASGGRDGWIKVWDINAKPLEDMPQPSAPLLGSELGNTRAASSRVVTTATHVRRASGDSLGHSSISSGVENPSGRKIKRRTLHRPVYLIEVAEKPVMRVKWRPEHPYLIAASSLKSPEITLWNVMDPHVPVASVNACDREDVANGFLWLDTFLDPTETVYSSLYDTSWWIGDEGEDDLEEVAENNEAVENLRDLSRPTKEAEELAEVPASERGHFRPIDLSYRSDSKESGKMPLHSESRLHPTAGLIPVSPPLQHQVSDLSYANAKYNASFVGHSLARPPSPAASVADSVISHRTNNGHMKNGDSADGNVLTLRDSQKIKFRKYRHKHRQGEDSQHSWGCLLSCTPGGKVTIRNLQRADKPLNRFRATAISLSVGSRLAAMHEDIPFQRLGGSFLVTQVLGPSEIEPPSHNKIHILGAEVMQSKRHRKRAMDFTDSLFGFDAEQFKTLAQGYMTPGTLSQTPEGSRLLSEHRLRHRIILQTNAANSSAHMHSGDYPYQGGLGVDGQMPHVASKTNTGPSKEMDSAQDKHKTSVEPYRNGGVDRQEVDTPDITKNKKRMREQEALLDQQAALTACCEHNASIADAAGALVQAQIWRLLMLIFSPQSVHLDLQTVSLKVKHPVVSAMQRSRVRTTSYASQSTAESAAPHQPRVPLIEPVSSDIVITTYNNAANSSDLLESSGALPLSNNPMLRTEPNMNKVASHDSVNKPKEVLGVPGVTGSPPHMPQKHLRTHSASSASKLSNTSLEYPPAGPVQAQRQVPRPRASSSSSHLGSTVPTTDSQSFEETDLDSLYVTQDMDALVGPGEMKEGDASHRSKRIPDRVALKKIPVDEESPESEIFASEPEGAQEITVKDPFSIAPARTQLWRPESINLLCRLSLALPMNESNFILSSKVLEDDVQELHDALDLAKPPVPVSPMPKGHQKLRRLHRMQRRQKFVQFYRQIYATQLQVQAEAPVQGPVSAVPVFAPNATRPLLQMPTAEELALSRGTSLSSALTYDADDNDQYAPGSHSGIVHGDGRPGYDDGTGNRHGAIESMHQDQESESEGFVSSQGGTQHLETKLGVELDGIHDVNGLATLGMGSEEGSTIASQGPVPLSLLGLSKSGLEKGEVVLSPFHIVTQNTSKFKSELVHDILQYHADIGDVQTCSMVILVLGDLLSPEVRPLKRRMWLCSYVDLLQQLRVYSVAARVISACHDPEVERCYQMSSMVAEGCGYCYPTNTKNLIMADDDFTGSCNTCKNTVSRCAICEEVVKGVYVWCQGCGHSGHLDHMTEWFKTETTCPTGCGHECTLSCQGGPWSATEE